MNKQEKEAFALIADYLAGIHESLADISASLQALVGGPTSVEFLTDDSAVEAAGEDLDVDLDQEQLPLDEPNIETPADPEPEPVAEVSPPPPVQEAVVITENGRSKSRPLTREELTEFNNFLIDQVARISATGINGETQVRNVLSSHNLRGLTEIKDRAMLDLIKAEVEEI